jgi:hypothetical protein
LCLPGTITDREGPTVAVYVDHGIIWHAGWGLIPLACTVNIPLIVIVIDDSADTNYSHDRATTSQILGL